MAWLKLDDRFAEHEKIAGLSDRAFRTHVAALCYCARNLTDGRLDDRAVNVVFAIVGTRSKNVLKELVSSGLWDTETDGYSVHDFTEYNPTSEQVKEDRRKAAERMRRLRSGRSSGERSEEQTPHVREPRPVPSPNKQQAVAALPPEPTPPADAATTEELEQLLDDLNVPNSLRQQAHQEPDRALACARYTISQNGTGGYFRTVFTAGDWPTVEAPRARSQPTGGKPLGREHYLQSAEAKVANSGMEAALDWIAGITTLSSGDREWIADRLSERSAA